MFTVLKKLFNLNSTPAHSDPTLKRYHPSLITTPTEIIDLLNEIKNYNPTCTLFFDNTKESYTSEIVEINTKENNILLDKLRPENGNKQLHVSKSVKATFLFNGGEASCQLTKTKQAIQNHNHQFNLPSRIYCHQSKTSQHVVDVHTLKIPFDGFSANNRLPVSGYAHELAEDSVSAYVTTNQVNLERNDLLKECHIILPDNRQVITFDLIINNVKKPTAQNVKTFLNGSIKSMTSYDRNKYDMFITSIERLELKKRNL